VEVGGMDVVQIKEPTHRLIPSRFPPIDLFERVSSPEEFQILHEIESLTNSRLRVEVGDISLVRKEDVVVGPGTSYIMAAFTHAKVDRDGGRFDKGFGAYYCARELKTAIEETKYHRAKFFRDFNSRPTRVDMRELVADLNQTLHTIVNRKDDFPEIYNPDDNSAGQELGKKLKTANSWGLQYSSVRAEGGVCYAVLRPPALSHCHQANHYEYHYDGDTISNVFHKSEVK